MTSVGNTDPTRGCAPATSPGERVISAAERILALALERPVVIESAELLADRRSRVYRVAIAGASRPTRTAILKVARPGPTGTYDPEDPDPQGSASFLLNEWAGYAWLQEFAELSDLTPRLLGADRDLGLLVLEDAGAGPSLADLLLGSDPDLAEQGLRAYAATLGRLHAQTAGRFAGYLRLRAGLGPSNGQALPTPGQLPADFETLALLMRGIGVEVSNAARDEVAAVSDTLDEAGPFFAYSPSDICPDNNRYLGSGRLRLFDFEGGGFRHALLDAAYLRLALPTCWCVNRLPAALPAALEAIYRGELARGCPAVDDDQLFERGLAAASAAWLIWSVTWQWQYVPVTDQPLGPTTFRQSILWRLQLFCAMRTASSHLPGLMVQVRTLARTLEDRWFDVSPMPFYPAFRAETGDPQP